MSNKDKIKELFNDRFSNFESGVDSGVWENVQQGLSASSSAAVSGSIFGTTGVVVMASVVAVVSTLGYLYVNSESEITPSIATKQTEERIKDSNTEANVPTITTSNTELEKKNTQVKKTEYKLVAEQTSSATSENITNITGETTEPIVNESQISEEEPNQNLVQENIDSENKGSERVEANIISKAPKTIDIKQQSRVVASPMGGKAPLNVSFNSLAEVKEIKWTFDDGTESTEVQPSHTYEIPGIYFVTMLAELTDGTIVMDKAVIEVKEDLKRISKSVEQPKIVVPNVITPNGDGENDVLSIDCSRVNSFTMSIYSVNGKLVYQSENPNEKWGGNDLYGNKLEDGVYYYLINLIGTDENVYVPKGYITLKR